MFTNLDSRKVRRRQSFTLLEVMLALAILVLLTGALFALVQGSLTATAILDQKQHRQAQVDGFLQLCQETFQRLPPRAILQSGVVEVKGGFVPVLVVHNAPGSLAWT
jgi:type II secretory pathway component PulJ